MKQITSLLLALVLLCVGALATQIHASAENSNLALGKPVTGIQPITDPDNTDTRKGDLTDGKFQEPGRGWYVGSGEPGADTYLMLKQNDNAPEANAIGTIDLGENALIDHVRVYVGTGINSYGITAPEIKVELSRDGETYKEFGRFVPNPGLEFWDFVTIQGTPTDAQYVRLTFTLTQTALALIAEVEVIGETREAPAETSAPEDPSEPSETPAATESTAESAAESVAESEISADASTEPGTNDFPALPVALVCGGILLVGVAAAIAIRVKKKA